MQAADTKTTTAYQKLKNTSFYRFSRTQARKEIFSGRK